MAGGGDTMTAADAIVLGGGPNGLICAAYLARSGHRVILLERRHETGGGLATDEYFGFRFNVHAVYHLMNERMPAHRELALADFGVRYLSPRVVAAFPFRTGGALVFTRDLQETARSIESYSSADAAAFVRMWADFQPLLEGYLIPMTYELPAPPVDQMVALEQTPLGRQLASLSERSIVEVIDAYGFTDPRVRLALLSFAAMWGLDLHEPLGYLYPLYLCRMMAAGLVKGGSHRLSSALYRCFLRHGGTVVDECEATRILIEDGAVAGVEAGGGRQFAARAVVSTLNPVQTFAQLVDATALPAELRDAVACWQWEPRTLFGLHLGIKGAVHFSDPDPRVNEAMIVFCGLETDAALLDHLQRTDAGQVSSCEWAHVSVPSHFDATLAPPGHAVLRAEAVVTYDAPWSSAGPAFGDSCLALLRRYARIDEIVLRRDYTPVDIEARLTTMTRGSIKHGAYTPLQMGFLRPNDLCSRSATPIRGLFVGGASMYPGGMILGGPGYLAARVVEEHLQRA